MQCVRRLILLRDFYQFDGHYARRAIGGFAGYARE
jgi:hypothetical protein